MSLLVRKFNHLNCMKHFRMWLNVRYSISLYIWNRLRLYIRWDTLLHQWDVVHSDSISIGVRNHPWLIKSCHKSNQLALKYVSTRNVHSLLSITGTHGDVLSCARHKMAINKTTCPHEVWHITVEWHYKLNTFWLPGTWLAVTRHNLKYIFCKLKFEAHPEYNYLLKVLAWRQIKACW